MFSGRPGYNFTGELREALEQARPEARRLGHKYVGTEHFLLGLIAQANSEAAGIMVALGVELDEVRKNVERAVPRGSATRYSEDLPMTSRAKKVLQLAMAQARGLDSRSVSSAHLLLGILLEQKGPGWRVLSDLGVTVEGVLSVIKTGSAPGVRIQIRIDDKSEQLIYEQIVSQVQEAIATGSARPGDRLPPVRQLADDLGIAPGTVSRAYSLLEESGAVTTEGARGTFVARREAPAAGKKERSEAVRALLRQVVVAAFHLGATAEDLRKELEQAMKDIFGTREAA